MIARPYEPPPDYPMLNERWPKTVRNNLNSSAALSSSSYRSHSIDTAVNRSSSTYFHHSHHLQRQQIPNNHSHLSQQNRGRHEYPICSVSPIRNSSHDPYFSQSPRSNHHQHEEMLRTRQFPEIAGLYTNDEQPALRRFTRYNQSISANKGTSVVLPPTKTSSVIMDNNNKAANKSSSGSIFSKSSKKPLFFMGNWTFRERNKSARPSISEALRDDRPQSMNLSDVRGSRSKSGEATMNRTSITIGDGHEFPRNIETRVPIRIERSSIVHRKPSTSTNTSLSSPSSSSTSTSGDYKTNITVTTDEKVAILRPKKEIDSPNNNRFSFQSCVQLRKSCPDLDAAAINNMEHHRVSKKRTRRAKEKITQAAWKKKHVKDWTLDDVLLWLQSNQMDEVASLLIGYDLSGQDLLQWNDQTLAQLGVMDPLIREKLVKELTKIIEDGPVIEEQRNNHKTLFDIVRQTSYDQVLAVETPLTTRDITVTHGRLGCLQITKVNGANLPLKEHDCLLEINERSGEQFKSALMLTKLISDSNGTPIRFVVLRRKTDTILDDSMKETSSSGISSSPQTPTE